MPATKATTPLKTVLQVWTMYYNAFVMGGSCHQPIACEVPVTKPVALGKGYKGYVITSPKGETHIAESETGAFVGTSLAQVRADIAEASEQVMRDQIAGARKLAAKAKLLPADEFWSKFRS